MVIIVVKNNVSLILIRDSAGSNVLYSGGFEFHQVNGYKTTQYAYNSNGAMKYDPRSGLTNN